ncbi:ornithine cyclodeaminase [Streptomyces sp. 3213]|uniref:ornithine cyclodeaminase family protein n=1 Tax=Streptomyces sp. 3213.3 TaxID=1855348 RepID=UPI000895A7A9|nr:ornithine cyclodeaminase family protein [Streptomyces sp. 3213.3]SEE80667.1 ornithine cyclodeaminase [Streptomyces sp. 3213] [Streptomyces sp. 3213.3]
MPRLLTRGDLDTLFEPAACLAALRHGFLTTGAATAVPVQRVRTEPPLFPGTATASLHVVKCAGAGSRNVMCLRDGTNGELLALLDAATVTVWRTGLAAALGTHVLAHPAEDAVVGVIGAGAQAEVTLRGLDVLRPYGQLLVHDTDFDRATDLAVRNGGKVLGSATEVASAADIVLLATRSRTPPLSLADTHAGQHFTSLGADEPGRREFAADLLDAALVVVDDRQLVASVGALAPSRIDTTFGDVLRGDHPGRTDVGARSVYVPAGLPWQDLALAWPAYRRAERDGVGRWVDLPG